MTYRLDCQHQTAICEEDDYDGEEEVDHEHVDDV